MAPAAPVVHKEVVAAGSRLERAPVLYPALPQGGAMFGRVCRSTARGLGLGLVAYGGTYGASGGCERREPEDGWAPV
jgi:hypothetical protein